MGSGATQTDSALAGLRGMIERVMMAYGWVLAGVAAGAVVTGLVGWRLNRAAVRRHRRQYRELLGRMRAQKSLAESGRLLGHLAHEIRNPLSTVHINLQLLREQLERLGKELPRITDRGLRDELSQFRQRQMRKIETVSHEAERLSDTLNEFLHYAGKMELHPVRVDVHQLLDELLDFFEPEAMRNHVQVRRDLSQEPAWCLIDERLFKQALLNLMINAVQAMTEGGELLVKSRAKEDMVRIDVIDTGPGIDAEKQKAIFEAYYTTRTGGTGLGLPICRRIIEEHDGRIDVHSELGKGSDFVIELPLRRAQAS